MSGHAPFPPSAAKRWMTCTASFPLGLQVPEPPSSEYADEGTRLHDVAALVLTTPIKPMSDSGYMKRYGRLPPVDPPKADLDALKPYLDYATKRMREASVVRIEEWIEHSALLSGTPDLLMLFNGKVDMLEVVDLKNGAGIIVDAEENEQLLTYAYMALMRLFRLKHPLPKNVRLTIVQPPDEAYPVKSWDTTSEYVLGHGNKVEEAIRTAIEGRGELVPGAHCRFCRAKLICPKLRGELVEALASGLPSTMSTGQLAQWLDRADRMEQFIGALRETGHRVATLAAAEGKPGIPGWGLKPKRSTRSWADEEVVLAIARKRKIKIWQDKLMSPAMAEKAHPNMPEELTRQIVAVSSGMNLVRLKAGEAPTHEVKLPDEATKMERMMANMSLAKLRK